METSEKSRRPRRTTPGDKPEVGARSVMRHAASEDASPGQLMILDHIRDRAAPVNLVPMPLFVQCWNLLGCVKAAPSNKAARCISGKTMHTAMKLTGGPLSESSQTGAEYQSANATPLLDLSPEFLIREQAEDVPDSVGTMMVRQTSRRIQKLERQLSAERPKHSETFVDLRRLAMKMAHEYQQKIMEALAGAHAGANTAPSGKSLHIKSDQPVNIFDAPAWATYCTSGCRFRFPRPASSVPDADSTSEWPGTRVRLHEAQGRGFIHAYSAIYAIYRTIYVSKPPIQKAVER